ncbi:MarR family transcriptional regulator [Microbacterium sp. NEAU-LLC]|uniref:MarR family transcriptional regulator n=1 Tax=Microbacterium helvum TaxID=2773713 RepID=A0ABR8NLS8_9MICO|nr:MarR family winged helix-turn-helix transcriptional regulator [Microbacterium helvum]MBD3940476.1 MarR family transcriptional regulator [Microbacterium helvum]
MRDVDDDAMFDFSLAVFRVNGLLTRNGERLTAPAGQSSARWQVLGRAADSPRTVAAMARELGHARQSVQRVADVLAAEGLVVYIDDPADRRARRVAITPDGERALAHIMTRYAHWASRMRTLTDPAVVAQATAVLTAVGDAIESDLEKEET